MMVRNCSAYSSTASSLLTVAPPEPSGIQGVLGVTDWDFLRPPDSSPVTESKDFTHHRPSLEDFDGEIAVFQV